MALINSLNHHIGHHIEAFTTSTWHKFCCFCCFCFQPQERTSGQKFLHVTSIGLTKKTTLLLSLKSCLFYNHVTSEKEEIKAESTSLAVR